MKIAIESLEPGSEFTIDGTIMVISGVSHIVSRNSVVESLDIQYEKKAEAAQTEETKTTVTDESNGDNKSKVRRKLSDEVITQT